MTYKTLLVEKEEHLAIVTLNRPPVNSLNREAYADLFQAFLSLEGDDRVRAIILTGQGDKAFAAGLDIKDVEGKSIPGYLQFSREVRRAMDAIATIPKPTVAAASGFVLGGGCELLLACDFRIVATDAVIGFPEVNLGILPGSGGTQRLSRLVGIGKAKEMIYTGDTLSGEEAERIGLATKAVPKAGVMQEALALANKLASKPPVALARIKIAMDTGYNLDLPAATALENESFTITYVSEDGREGLRAMGEKRKPEFKGR